MGNLFTHASNITKNISKSSEKSVNDSKKIKYASIPQTPPKEVEKHESNSLLKLNINK